VNSPHGTATNIRLPGMDMAGKTGTAQVVNISGDKIYQSCFNMKFRDRHNGVFVGFAPVNDPKIAVAVVAEHTCHGNTGAGPIAQAVVKTYLQKYEPALYGDKAIADRLKDEKLQRPVMVKAKEPETDDEDVTTDNNTRSVVDPEDNEAPPPPLPPGAN
jgi:membrane peptidoglycan carboxypeptidase